MSEKVKMNCLDIDIKSANFTTNGSSKYSETPAVGWREIL